MLYPCELHGFFFIFVGSMQTFFSPSLVPSIHNPFFLNKIYVAIEKQIYSLFTHFQRMCTLCFCYFLFWFFLQFVYSWTHIFLQQISFPTEQRFFLSLERILFVESPRFFRFSVDSMHQQAAVSTYKFVYVYIHVIRPNVSFSSFPMNKWWNTVRRWEQKISGVFMCELKCRLLER